MTESKRAKQLAFNGVWRGLKSQGFERSVDARGMCVYRGAHDRKCAAGWLIKDEHYWPGMEGRPASGATVRPSFAPTFDQFSEIAPVFFIWECQDAHDNGLSPSVMRANLGRIASIHGLTIPDGDES